MKTYDLYGLNVDSLEDARVLVESALSIELVPHESGYHCGAYFRLGNVGREHFVVQKNFDDSDGEWTVPEHKDRPFLLYVNETDRAETIGSLLAGRAGVSLLLRKELE